MKGAAAVVDRRISTPSSNRMATIGRSHHFLLWARKSKNSATRLSSLCLEAALSNSLSGGGWLMGAPELRETGGGDGRGGGVRRAVGRGGGGRVSAWGPRSGKARRIGRKRP